MNIQVFPAYDGPDLNGEILIETDRSIGPLSSCSGSWGRCSKR